MSNRESIKWVRPLNLREKKYQAQLQTYAETVEVCEEFISLVQK